VLYKRVIVTFYFNARNPNPYSYCIATFQGLNKTLFLHMCVCLAISCAIVLILLYRWFLDSSIFLCLISQITGSSIFCDAFSCQSLSLLLNGKLLQKRKVCVFMLPVTIK